VAETEAPATVVALPPLANQRGDQRRGRLSVSFRDVSFRDVSFRDVSFQDVGFRDVNTPGPVTRRAS
jgi:hypothetical protein